MGGFGVSDYRVVSRHGVVVFNVEEVMIAFVASVTPYPPLRFLGHVI